MLEEILGVIKVIGEVGSVIGAVSNALGSDSKSESSNSQQQPIVIQMPPGCYYPQQVGYQQNAMIPVQQNPQQNMYGGCTNQDMQVVANAIEQLALNQKTIMERQELLEGRLLQRNAKQEETSQFKALTATDNRFDLL